MIDSQTGLNDGKIDKTEQGSVGAEIGTALGSGILFLAEGNGDTAGGSGVVIDMNDNEVGHDSAEILVEQLEAFYKKANEFLTRTARTDLKHGYNLEELRDEFTGLSRQLMDDMNSGTTIEPGTQYREQLIGRVSYLIGRVEAHLAINLNEDDQEMLSIRDELHSVDEGGFQDIESKKELEKLREFMKQFISVQGISYNDKLVDDTVTRLKRSINEDSNITLDGLREQVNALVRLFGEASEDILAKARLKINLAQNMYL